MNAPDLTKNPPRSPRVRLGGYTILPRILDKARATLAGLNGEYGYKKPTDWHFFRFTGIDPEALLEKVQTGAGDWEILQWIQDKAPQKHTPWEISQWSTWTENFAFHDVEMREWFTEEIKRINPARDDIQTLFDRLDLDDYISFGGRA
ncbi:MAG: DUF5069 domain-containing protein [Prosthecobacter sp.]|nr:DUF5069 domain-containing protein [Prosthecobacter sp.]